MSKPINSSTSPTDDIKDRLPVEQLISEYLTLKRAGVNFKGLCPFHSEKTPSFMVSPERRSWHCFGCDKGGDVFTFVMEMEGLEFKEALKYLAKKSGVTLPRYQSGDPKKAKLTNRLYQISELAAEFFQKELKETSKDAAQARQELERRKVDDLTRDLFKIGFAPADWETLSNFLVKRGYNESEIVAAGLAVARPAPKKGIYDRFRNRLMFPLVDVVGRVVGFSARALDPDEKMGKYINSPETEIYHKGKFMYALNLAKQAIRQKNFVILVEGQMDAVSSHRVGVTNVVATSGTALTVHQLTLIKRYTENLILAFDFDLAGASATKKGIDLAISLGFSVKVVNMPAGVDPDDLVCEDPKKWGLAVNKSEGIIDYYMGLTTRGKDTTMVETKKAVAAVVLPEIARLENEVEKTHYLQKLGNLVDVEETVLRKSLSGQKNTADPKTHGRQDISASPQKKKPASVLTRRLSRLVALMLSADLKKGGATLLTPLRLSSDIKMSKIVKLLTSTSDKREVLKALDEIKPVFSSLINKELFSLEQANDEVEPRSEVTVLVELITRDLLKAELKQIQRKTGVSDKAESAKLQKLFAERTKVLAALEKTDSDG